MPIIYSVQLKCKVGVALEAIHAAMQEWVRGTDPTAVDLIDIHTKSSHDETSNERGTITGATALHPTTKARCTAIRSSTNLQLSKNNPPQQTNLLWKAEFISEEAADGTRLYINLNRCAASSDAPADLEKAPIPPRIISILIKNNLLQPDCGIPFTPLFHAAQDVTETVLMDAASGRTLTAIPLVLLSETQQLFAHALVKTLRGTAHIFLLPDTHPLRTGLKSDQVVLLYPRANAQKQYIIARGQAQHILSDVLRLTYFAAPIETLTFDAVDYWSILQGGTQVSHEPKAGYIFVNPAMAEAIRFHRKKSGLTQAELGEKVCSTGLVISRVENNKTTRIPEQMLANIERELGVAPGTLAFMENTQSVPQEEPSMSAATSPVHSFCYKCGTKLLEDSIFCHACGTKLPV